MTILVEHYRGRLLSCSIVSKNREGEIGGRAVWVVGSEKAGFHMAGLVL